MTETMKRKRRLNERQLAKVLADFDLPARIDEVMARLGPLAWRIPTPRPDVAPGCQRPVAGLRDRWIVATSLGMLGLSCYDDWIACVFEEEKRAAKALNYPGVFYGDVNPHSGKWNHHAFVRVGDYTEAKDARWALEMLVTLFTIKLDAITGGDEGHS